MLIDELVCAKCCFIVLTEALSPSSRKRASTDSNASLTGSTEKKLRHDEAGNADSAMSESQTLSNLGVNVFSQVLKKTDFEDSSSAMTPKFEKTFLSLYYTSFWSSGCGCAI